MTPIESRSGDNKNCVKCFTIEDLDAGVAAKENWDLVKVTCTQTFNKRDPFGLTFITIMGKVKKIEENKEVQSVPVKAETPKKMIGRFAMRDDSDDEDDGPKGVSIMNRWKRKTTDNLTDPASKLTMKNSTSAAPKNTKYLDRNRESLLYSREDEDDDRFYGTGKKIIAEKEKKQAEKRKAEESENTTPKRKTKDFNEFLSSKGNDQSAGQNSSVKKKDHTSSTSFSPTRVATQPKNPDIKPQTRPRLSQNHPPSPPDSPPKLKTPKKPKNITYKPFNQLFRGVTFVISGIQNPDRAELRSLALELGARYAPDWNNNCTHLICAFKNTPKYREVQGKGKIVTKDWIIQCHEQRKRLPWRRFALDDKLKEKHESEDEVWDEKDQPKPNKTSPSTSSSKKFSPIKHSNSEDKDDVLDLYDLGYDDPPPTLEASDNGNEVKEVDDPYSKSTDDESEAPKSQQLSQSSSQPVPGIFSGKKFYFHPSIKDTDVIIFEHSVPDQGGKIITDLHRAHYVISEVPFSKDAGLKGEVLKPRWVFESLEMECLIPTKRYKVE